MCVPMNLTGGEIPHLTSRVRSTIQSYGAVFRTFRAAPSTRRVWLVARSLPTSSRSSSLAKVHCLQGCTCCGSLEVRDRFPAGDSPWTVRQRVTGNSSRPACTCVTSHSRRRLCPGEPLRWHHDGWWCRVIHAWPFSHRHGEDAVRRSPISVCKPKCSGCALLAFLGCTEPSEHSEERFYQIQV